MTISTPSPLSSMRAVASSTAAASASRRLSAHEMPARELDSALRVVYFSTPRQSNVAASKEKIAQSGLPSNVKAALEKNVAGTFGMSRVDNKEEFVIPRSSRLTSGQIARDTIVHIERMLASGTTLRLADDSDSVGSHAILVQDRPLSEAQKTELTRYKNILSFFSATTAWDFSLTTEAIEECLDANGFCVIHDNYKNDKHSQAILLHNNPPQLMFLNRLNEEIRPVPESHIPVGGDKLQWNKLYVFARNKFEQVKQKVVQNYNAGLSLLSETDPILFGKSADADQHPTSLYHRQFLRPPVGYGCSFKTMSDIEESVLSPELRSKVKDDREALARLALKEKNLPLDQPLREEQIWSPSDFPHKSGTPKAATADQLSMLASRFT